MPELSSVIFVATRIETAKHGCRLRGCPVFYRLAENGLVWILQHTRLRGSPECAPGGGDAGLQAVHTVVL